MAVPKSSPGLPVRKTRFDDVVSLVGVKDVAKELPETSMAKQLIMKMDDSMPRWIALGQMLLVDKILYQELGR